MMPKTLLMKLVKSIPQTTQELLSALGMCASAEIFLQCPHVCTPQIVSGSYMVNMQI